MWRIMFACLCDLLPLGVSSSDRACSPLRKARESETELEIGFWQPGSSLTHFDPVALFCRNSSTDSNTISQLALTTCSEPLTQ